MAGGAYAGATTEGEAAVGGAALEPPVGGGEEQCTRGRKALPPRVFSILKPEKERKEIGFIKGGGGGGRGK